MRESQVAGRPGRRRRGPAGRPWRERGSATAEIAVTLPVLAVVLALLLWGAAVAVAHVECQDAARLAARAAARGESAGSVQQAARAAAPEGAHIAVTRQGGLVRVTVSATVGPRAGVLRSVVALPVQAVAVTPSEAR